MSNYLLLRDNKQHGPYSFDEIKAKGLKAYDLVWVEGRSAAWRYPGEIEELKPFSPEVVEQPYDRFFKKPIQQEAKPIAQVRQPVAVAEKETEPVPMPQEQPAQVVKKNVYVTLPASSKIPVIRAEAQPTESVRKETVATRPIQQDDYAYSLQSPTAAVAVETFTTQEQKETAYHYTPTVQKIQVQPVFERFKKPVLTGIAILLLLGAGIFIGATLGSRSGNHVKNTEPNGTLADQHTNAQTTVIPVSTTGNDQQKDIQPDNTKNSLVPVQQDITRGSGSFAKNENKRVTVPKEKAAFVPKIVPDPTVVTDSGSHDNTSSILPVQHREAVHRTDAAGGDNDAAKTTLTNMVSVGANKYTVGTFGGISELQVTVSNHSQHPMDLVVVEVQYIQANKKVFKTENLYFKNINAGGALMQEGPKSPRGIKVQYKITLINSKESGLSYSPQQ